MARSVWPLWLRLRSGEHVRMLLSRPVRSWRIHELRDVANDIRIHASTKYPCKFSAHIRLYTETRNSHYSRTGKRYHRRKHRPKGNLAQNSNPKTQCDNEIGERNRFTPPSRPCGHRSRPVLPGQRLRQLLAPGTRARLPVRQSPRTLPDCPGRES